MQLHNSRTFRAIAAKLSVIMRHHLTEGAPVLPYKNLLSQFLTNIFAVSLYIFDELYDFTIALRLYENQAFRLLLNQRSFCASVYEIKGTDDVLLVEDGPQISWW